MSLSDWQKQGQHERCVPKGVGPGSREHRGQVSEWPLRESLSCLSHPFVPIVIQTVPYFEPSDDWNTPKLGWWIPNPGETTRLD